MNSRDICIALDDFRVKRKITREEFLDGVISIRQYKRYLYGETEMPFQILVKLSDKLNTKPYNLLYEINHLENKETEELNTFYFKVVSNTLGKHLEAVLMNKSKFYSKKNKVYHSLILYLHQFRSKNLKLHSFLERCSTLIDYPNILKYKIVDSIDFLGLVIILNYSKTNRDQIAAKLYKIVTSDDGLISGRNKYLIPYAVINLVKYYGPLGEFDKSISLLNIGLNQLTEIRSNYLLDYHYYFLSLINYKTKNTKDFNHNLMKLYFVMHAEGNKQKIDFFKTLIQKDFDISPNQLLEIVNLQASRT